MTKYSLGVSRVRRVLIPDELSCSQVPLFDAEVSGGTEEGVSAHGQTLDAVVVWWVQVGRRGYYTT